MWFWWLLTGWAAKSTWDTFRSKVATAEKQRAVEWAKAFQSGLDSDDAPAIDGLATAFEQQGETVYASKLRAHAAELRGASAVATPHVAAQPVVNGGGSS